MDKLLSTINRELSKHQLIVSHGIKIDASLTESPRKPKRKITYEIAEYRHEDDITDEEEREQVALLKK